ncbi:hypothetical protein [uncultured Cyclobacterium sp.]|uniref:hypothetical protein n=1 Tax=uncultured Cyclobacterium sp. TaxID=453820 RepID=UPI0030ECDA47
MKNSFKFLLGVFLMLGVSVRTTLAQCAMCRATIENNVSNGDTTVGATLNFGILYLFVAPYVLLSILGYLWYKNARRKKKLSL